MFLENALVRISTRLLDIIQKYFLCTYICSCYSCCNTFPVVSSRIQLSSQIFTAPSPKYYFYNAFIVSALYSIIWKVLASYRYSENVKHSVQHTIQHSDCLLNACKQNTASGIIAFFFSLPYKHSSCCIRIQLFNATKVR
jgi:hypothetical protein